MLMDLLVNSAPPQFKVTAASVDGIGILWFGVKLWLFGDLSSPGNFQLSPLN